MDAWRFFSGLINPSSDSRRERQVCALFPFLENDIRMGMGPPRAIWILNLCVWGGPWAQFWKKEGEKGHSLSLTANSPPFRIEFRNLETWWAKKLKFSWLPLCVFSPAFQRSDSFCAQKLFMQRNLTFPSCPAPLLKKDLLKLAGFLEFGEFDTQTKVGLKSRPRN